MANTLRIEFRGLVDLVSNRTSDPGLVWVLFPNATNPQAGWYPGVLKFNHPHQPRLLIRHGNVASGSTESLTRCPSGSLESLPGVRLNNQHVTFEGSLSPSPIRAVRGSEPPTDPNVAGADLQNLHFVADMEDLASSTHTVPPLGGVSADLLNDPYTSDPQRIISRMILEAGTLKTGALWWKDGSYPLVEFIEKPGGGGGGYSAYLAEQIGLECQMGNEVTFKLRALNDTGATPDTLVLKPEDGLLDLIVENAPDHCHNPEEHFIAHYLIRDGWKNLEKVLMPDVADWVGTSNDNPQCSPADNLG